MTKAELAKGSMIFITVIAAGSLSERYVDRTFAKAEATKNLASHDKVEAPGPPAPRGACVDEEGSWKNWVWANLPMLSPKCADR